MSRTIWGLILVFGFTQFACADEPAATAAMADSSQPVLLKVKVIELSLTDMRDLGVDIDAALAKPVDPSGVPGLLQFMKRNHVMTELATMSVVTVSGGSADLEIGTGRGDDGSEVHIVPTLLDGGRVRVALHARQIGAEALQPAAGGAKAGGADAGEADSQLEMAFGSQTLCGGPILHKVRTERHSFRPSTETIVDSRLLYAVTAERVPATAKLSAPPTGTN